MDFGSSFYVEEEDCCPQTKETADLCSYLGSVNCLTVALVCALYGIRGTRSIGLRRIPKETNGLLPVLIYRPQACAVGSDTRTR